MRFTILRSSMLIPSTTCRLCDHYDNYFFSTTEKSFHNFPMYRAPRRSQDIFNDTIVSSSVYEKTFCFACYESNIVEWPGVCFRDQTNQNPTAASAHVNACMLLLFHHLSLSVGSFDLTPTVLPRLHCRSDTSSFTRTRSSQTQTHTSILEHIQCIWNPTRYSLLRQHLSTSLTKVKATTSRTAKIATATGTISTIPRIRLPPS